MTSNKTIALFALTLLPFSASSQEAKVDALIEASIAAENPKAQYNAIVEAMALAKSIKYKGGLGKSYLEMGLYQKNIERNYNAALSGFGKAMQIKMELKDSAGIASVYNNMSSVYLELYQLEEAKNCSQQAISIYTKLNDSENLIRTYNNCANVYEEILGLDTAIYFNQKTLSIIESAKDVDTSTWIDATYGLGKRYLKNEGYEESKKQFLVCLELAQKTADTVAIGMAYEGLGAIEFTKGEFPLAREYFEKAHEIYSKMKEQDPASMASLLLNLGNVYHAQEEFNKASEAYKNARTSLENKVEFGATLGALIEQNAASNDLVYKKYLQRNILGAVVIVALVLVVFFFYRLANVKGENIVLKENVLVEKEKAVLAQQELNEKDKDLLKVRESAVFVQKELNEKEKDILSVREENVKAREEIQRLRNLHHLAISDHLDTMLVYLRGDNFNVFEFKYLVEESIEMLKARPNEHLEEIMLGIFTERMLAKAKFNAKMEIALIKEIDDALNYRLKGLTRKNLTAIVDLAFSNIRNHAQCDTASLLFEVEGNSLFMEIKDNGKGFDINAVREGAQGVVDIMGKAAEMNAVCIIDSKIGKGTKISIRVPSPFTFS